MIKNLKFPCFIDVFMSYCPLFWGSKAIYNDLMTRYMFECYDQKLVVLMFDGHFRELLPTSLGFRWICMARKTHCMFESYDKIVVFAFFGRLHELLPTVLGSRAIFNDL